MTDSLSLNLLSLPEAEFPRTWAALRTAIEEGVAPGAVAGFWSAQTPDSIFAAAIGSRRKFPSEQPMELETVFDLASVTKVMATATLTATLVQRGWIDWSTPLQSFFPKPYFGGIELRHLLSHTAGFVAWQPFWERLRERFAPTPVERISVRERQQAMRDLVLAVQPDAAPGERCTYSDVSFLLLGFVLEEVTQMPLDKAVRHFLWDPMGVRGAYFRRVTRAAGKSRVENVAATEDCPWRCAVVQGQVHDDNCWAMGGYAGHAGAFGNVRDVLQFAKALMQGFLSPKVRAEAWTRVSPPPGCDRTLGWDTPSGPEPAASRLFSPRSIGHLGFTGTSLWIDPDERLAVTLLTNRVHPTRENPRIKAFRSHFHAALRQDLNQRKSLR